mgnify:CR=1 FL=1
MLFRTTKELTKEDCEVILQKNNINSNQLEQLLDAREANHTDFNLVDVRELIEWHSQRILHTDYLIPTTSFYEKLIQIDHQKEKPTILYCHIGQRSAYCQKIMIDLGFKHVVNLLDGIAGFRGKTQFGE